MKKLSRVTNFLSSIEENKKYDTEVIVSGVDTFNNIFAHEIIRWNKLENTGDELLKYITDSKTIRRLSYKEKQHLFCLINEAKNDSRDFIVRITEMANKNEIIRDVISKLSGDNKQIVTSSNGEKYISTIDDETRQNLNEIIIELVNERVKDI